MFRTRRFGNLAALNGSGTSFDPATIAWVNAVISAGGTVSGTREGIVDTLIKAIKTNLGPNVNSIIDRLWLLASENTQQANIDIVNLGTWTSHGTITFAANLGYTGDGSTGFLDTGFNPSTAGGNLSLNSGFITATTQTLNTGVFTELGALSSTNAIQMIPNGDFSIVNSAAGNYSADTVAGNWIYSRTASNLTTKYKNGSSVGTDVTVSTGLPNANIFIGARNNAGTADTLSPDQISIAGFGSGLNSTQAGALSTAIANYMASI